jgi:hypothetical protein
METRSHPDQSATPSRVDGFVEQMRGIVGALKDGTRPTAEVVEEMCAAVREQELASIKAHVLAGIENRLRAGLPSGGQVPWGFRWGVEREWIVDEEVWPAVKLAFWRAAEGASCAQIQAELRENGFVVSQEKLRKALQKTLYVTGCASVRFRGKEFSLRPVVLSDPIHPEVFAAVQTALDARGR